MEFSGLVKNNVEFSGVIKKNHAEFQGLDLGLKISERVSLFCEVSRGETLLCLKFVGEK